MKKNLVFLAALMFASSVAVNASEENAVSPAAAENTSSGKSGDSSAETEQKKEKKYLGQLSGSFETNTIYYVNDPATGSTEGYGSNNHLKLDYTYKGFSAGFQAEWYPNVLKGYPKEFNEGFHTTLKNGQTLGLPMIPFAYVSWQNSFMSATVGSFYEQFGSGLLFRSWEDRTLGLNNAMNGVKLAFNIKDIVNIKVLSGVPRMYMMNLWDKDYRKSLFTGADVSFSLSNAIGLTDHYITVEGSLLHKYDPWRPTEDEKIFSDPVEEYGLGMVIPSNVVSFSARANYAWEGLTASFEYVGKGKDLYTYVDGRDPRIAAGNAILAELGYSIGGLSMTANFRRLINMRSEVVRDPIGRYTTTSNTMNYLPALSPQHAFSLATMYPYYAHQDGEIGGQIDVFYKAKRNTWLGGARGTKFHANFSTYYSENPYAAEGEKKYGFLYREATVDMEKAWTKWFQTTVFYSYQLFERDERNAFALDMLFKINRKYSIRTELQYLHAPKVSGKDWMAATVEFNMAPMWSIFVTDIYNHGGNKVHYYNAGFAFTHSIVRAALSYGRNKEGYICSGGVCRYVPEYTGLNFSLNVRF